MYLSTFQHIVYKGTLPFALLYCLFMVYFYIAVYKYLYLSINLNVVLNSTWLGHTFNLRYLNLKIPVKKEIPVHVNHTHISVWLGII